MEVLMPVVVVVCLLATKTQGEIRCYCNEPQCVPSGYMCKSKLGHCFSQFTTENNALSRSSHGCIETLPYQARKNCDTLSTELTSGTSDSHMTLCCEDDMCNYKASLDISILISTKTNETKESIDDSPSQKTPSLFVNKERVTGESIQNSLEKDLWFKAAVIAVPIAGGFILVMLVLLAVRMLKHDSKKRHQRLKDLRRQKSFTKAQSYVTDHFSEKSCESRNSHFPPLAKQNKLYKDISIKIDVDRGGYEKLEKSSSSDSDARSSIVVWGKQNSESNLTVV